MTQQSAFSPEQVAERSIEHVNAFILGNIAYLKERNQSVEEWARFIGQRFAPGWEELRGQGARAAMEQLALNWVSSGATLLSLSGDEGRAEAAMSGWPPQDFAESLGLSEADIEPFWGAYAPIAESIGLRYEYERQGNMVTLRLSTSASAK